MELCCSKYGLLQVIAGFVKCKKIRLGKLQQAMDCCLVLVIALFGFCFVCLLARGVVLLVLFTAVCLFCSFGWGFLFFIFVGFFKSTDGNIQKYFYGAKGQVHLEY